MTAPRITLSMRAAVARGQPFAPYGETFCDPAVVRDVLGTFVGAEEPLVVRVAADAADCESVVGDWFCGADGSPPERIPAPAWYDDEDCEAWARAQGSWLDAWERCARADWMLFAAVSVGTNLRLVAVAAAACVRTVLEIAPRGAVAPMRAIEVVLAWSRGEDDFDQLEAARVELNHYIVQTALPNSAWFAAAQAVLRTLGLAVGDGSYASWAAASIGDDASYAAHYAANAFVSGGLDTRENRLREMARIVRAELPTAEVLRAATRGFDTSKEHAPSALSTRY